jgi:hypothetical protein
VTRAAKPVSSTILPPAPGGGLSLRILPNGGIEILGITGCATNWKRRCTRLRRLDMPRFLAPFLPLPTAAGDWVGDIFAETWQGSELLSVILDWREDVAMPEWRPPEQ